MLLFCKSLLHVRQLENAMKEGRSNNATSRPKVLPLHLSQKAFSVALLFLDSSSDVASLRRYTYTVLSKRKLTAE